MSRTLRLLIGLTLFTLSALDPALAQEARSRWERMAQIHRDKFDHVLPDAMRENGIDMWITVVREGLYDPLFEDLGRGYVGDIGYYIFTDRGSDRIERAALGIDGYLLERNGAYDLFGSADLRQFVAERDPKRIGVNISRSIGAADGLSHSSFEHLVEILGQPYATRMVSAERIIQRGDLLMIDWGVGYLNLYTDMKRIGYVLRVGETAVPAGIQNAFEQGLRVREIIRKTISAGPTAGEMLDRLNAEIAAAGFEIMKQFNVVSGGPMTEVMIGCHSVGNLGHGIGPSIAAFNPLRMTFEIKPSNLFSIELFAWTAAPEWGGAKVRIPLEDDAIVTEGGVEWLYPVNQRILLIR